MDRAMAMYTVQWDETPPECCRGGALTIGNFDGVHRGHAALLAKLGDEVRARGGPSVALTFDPHPLQLLRPEQFQPVLTTVTDRAELLQALGADYVLILRTTWELLRLSPEAFFSEVIQTRLQPQALIEGNNFGFGRNREGTVETLAKLCAQAGVGLSIVPPVTMEGLRVSSSSIRAVLLKGDVRTAALLLGRPYRLRGLVGTGQRRGQKLGFPTANLVHVETLVPADGVYAVRVQHQQRTWPGAANIGPNPTFGEQARKVEVHLIGFEGTLYGQTLTIHFLERLRDTRPFAGVEQLVAQLRVDVDQARRLAEAVP
jgi:riboflavin kinase/FMN adenylyltransferase